MRVHLLGRGVATSLGKGVSATLERLVRAESGLREVHQEDLSGLPVSNTFGPFPESLWAKAVSPRDSSLLGNVLDEALEESGPPAAGERTGVFFSELPQFSFDERTGEESYPENPSKTDHAIAHLMSRGEHVTKITSVTATCATGLRLLSTAELALKSKTIDRAIVFSLSRATCPLTVAGLARALALSRYSGPAAFASRPFDSQRSGFVLSDAASALVLSSRPRLGAPSVEVLSVATVMGGRHAFRPSSALMSRVMRKAQQRAHLPLDAISVVFAMGASSILGDEEEARALWELFEERITELPICALKSMLGYSMQASSLVELALLSECMLQGILLPVPTCQRQSSSFPLRLARSAEKRSLRVGLINSFGLGGHYGSAVLSTVA